LVIQILHHSFVTKQLQWCFQKAKEKIMKHLVQSWFAKVGASPKALFIH
jgi:hypothetical protein